MKRSDDHLKSVTLQGRDAHGHPVLLRVPGRWPRCTCELSAPVSIECAPVEFEQAQAEILERYGDMFRRLAGT
ncbi:hypothetical protein [Deinococcus gobiensis]|uniref:Uncharacterized protein n=1 Tax=Deinococcus gobiensis (strain DSM 21396 / JCM 16679 / CGMCC 1.7299 / I-0) TaxID=745776 RepID=H8H2H8_DEIGI|nr:hypothetical protein [Deinococcus gobiensis]AFD27725.1 hypothetical protein DGo_PB0456 [Deinococcus gobiensis I-0]